MIDAQITVIRDPQIFVMTGVAIGLAPPVTGLLALILAPFIF